MTEATLKRANEIKQEIDRLENEMKQLPRYIVSSVNDKWADRVLRKDYHVKLLHRAFDDIPAPDIYKDDRLILLSDEDLEALVELRRRKVVQLRKELGELS